MAEYLGYDGQGFVRAEQITGQAVSQGMWAMPSLLKADISLAHVIADGSVHPCGRKLSVWGIRPDEYIRGINSRPAKLQIVDNGIANFF